MLFKKEQVPHGPGVYIFQDKAGRILYVGKAVDLRTRVSSYFSGKSDNIKTEDMVENIASLETIKVLSEIEALILEANLIKKYLPPYNIKLTDDKDYLYIKITGGHYPKIITARKNELSDAKKYFGPFPSSRVVRDTLKKLRRIFPWCNGTGNRAKGIMKSRPCFYYHLGLCPGACVGKISRQDYNKIINRFSRFMEGKTDTLLHELKREMGKYSQKTMYEQAQTIKKTIDGLQYLMQSTSIKGYLENPNFLEEQNKFSLESLQNDLGLNKISERIECFDISNISGKNATGSMVVLTAGELDKSQYRKFKIQLAGKPNDVAMMREIIRRRFKHQEWPMPDLIIVDGGRGQANVVNDELRTMNYELPVFGLAKKMEWLYRPDGNVIRLPHSSFALRLLQKIRDEAHRFAINYHRKLRSKMLY
ncbi:hypothetical protein A2617_04880 [Candidatus Daviesbacteria bacterium RIFOXYD1_FULL_41_10]|uniref:Excinuclease ABC subunit C n=2 Tax=Candidatus Daviesiibacteriota TaxID=1752718 RepID=A0A1F5N2V9_9BACT|nr:MAG: Excinuclease ABC subunit C [Candidatus Daviesbacteria bacterium GW2011_GWB1_41_5]OGE71979.1 MAG: hypothetical protein A2617_04880 [Candidatus Daviesbacteria bacterium RIFOXYD1_FULL_41_10]